MRDTGMRITAVRSPDDVEVWEVDASRLEPERRTLEGIAAGRTFAPHPGWRGFVERSAG
jgi:hypothetical protein